MDVLVHPAVGLFAVAVTIAVGLRRLFLLSTAWLWHFAADVKMTDVVPWARWAMEGRDGAEPYALVAMVLLQWLLTAAGVVLLGRLAPRLRAAAVAGLLVIAGMFAIGTPPRPPLWVVDMRGRGAVVLVAGSWLAVALLRLAMRRRLGVPVALALALLPICFVRTTSPSLLNMVAILEPGLRLVDGTSPSQIYMQYDLFPSLLAVAWNKVGGAPVSFGVAVAAVYYVMMLAVFVLARRLFRRSALAAPMLVSLLLVRAYGAMGDPLLCPQVTPMRLDMWVLLILAALAKGLRHWTVGLVLAGLCFFSHTFATIYLGAYFLALGADLLAERRATPALRRSPLSVDVRALAVAAAPSLGLIALSFLAARLVFGSFGSDAVRLYRELGVGMLRIDPASFYWWLLPLTGAVGWLAFSMRAALPERRGQAAILAVALLLASSIYFFGRSHEHNLINTATAFLFCAFLALDLGWPREADPLAVRAVFRIAPWAIVAACAYFYSGRAVDKLTTQAQQAMTERALPPADAGDVVPKINCAEINNVASDGRAYFFSKSDTWYYQACHIVAQGYVQPMWLSILKKPLAEEMTRLLDQGFKIFVPTQRGDEVAAAFDEVARILPTLDREDTPSFRVFRRRGLPMP